MKRLALLFGLFTCSIAYGQFKYWEPLIGPSGGRVNSTAIDSNQRLYVGTAIGGVFYSTNNGDTWKPLNRGLNDLSTKRIEAGRDGYVYLLNSIGTEFARFYDTGIGWEYLQPWADSFFTRPVADLVVTRYGTVYVCGFGGGGIRRSTDHGDTWTSPADTSLKAKKIRHLAASVTHDTLFALDDSGYIYRSVDAGDVWAQVPGRKPRSKILTEYFEITPNGSLLIASRIDLPNPGGKIYRSTDLGVSWDTVWAPSDDHIAFVIVRSPLNGDLYATTFSLKNRAGGFYRSTDNGLTWVLRNDGELGEDKFWMAVNKQGWIFHSSAPEGIFLSTDRGVIWNPKNTGLLAQYLLGTAMNSKGDIFTITQFGLFRSINPNPGFPNPGEIWQLIKVPQIETNLEPIIRILPGDIVYTGTYFGLFRSIDKGDHFDFVIKTQDSTKQFQVFDVQQAPNGWVYACTDKKGLLVSKDEGKTFAEVPNLPKDEVMTAIAFSGDTVLAISLTGDCWRSTNGGVNWLRVAQSIVGSAASLIHTPDGSYIVLMNSELKRSTDIGTTWDRIFPDSALNEQRWWTGAFYSLFLTGLGHVLVGTDTGVWRSTGPPYNQWEQIGYGITATDYRLDRYANVAQFAEDPNNHYIYAATRGQSMFRSTARYVYGVKLPSSVAIPSGQIYPNPFPRQTQILVTTSEPGDAVLEVFNTLGESVIRQSQGRIDAGEHSIAFDGSQIPSGSYLYVLHLGGKPAARGWMQIIR